MFTQQQIGALRMTGFDPDDQRVVMMWNAVNGLSAQDRETLIIMLLAAPWPESSSGLTSPPVR